MLTNKPKFLCNISLKYVSNYTIFVVYFVANHLKSGFTTPALRLTATDCIMTPFTVKYKFKP